ncbi:MAG: recombinase family protein [Pseudoclavibacter sp.]
MSVIGYARAGGAQAQLEALAAAGAEQVFTDSGVSARVSDRPAWAKCLDALSAGDTLLVYRLDRLAVGEKMAVDIINDLSRRGADLRSLTEPDIDTTTPQGRALFSFAAVLARLNTNARREGTRQGLDRARARGRVGGRPSVMTPARLAAAAELREQGETIVQIAAELGVSKSTIARTLVKLDAGNDQRAGEKPSCGGELSSLHGDTRP